MHLDSVMDISINQIIWRSKWEDFRHFDVMGITVTKKNTCINVFSFSFFNLHPFLYQYVTKLDSSPFLTPDLAQITCICMLSLSPHLLQLFEKNINSHQCHHHHHHHPKPPSQKKCYVTCRSQDVHIYKPNRLILWDYYLYVYMYPRGSMAIWTKPESNPLISLLINHNLFIMYMIKWKDFILI